MQYSYLLSSQQLLNILLSHYKIKQKRVLTQICLHQAVNLGYTQFIVNLHDQVSNR